MSPSLLSAMFQVCGLDGNRPEEDRFNAGWPSALLPDSQELDPVKMQPEGNRKSVYAVLGQFTRVSSVQGELLQAVWHVLGRALP